MRGIVVTCVIAGLAGCGGLTSGGPTTGAPDAAPEAATRDGGASEDAATDARDATTRDAADAADGLSCPASMTACSGGFCADLQTDFDNCGACGHACTPGQVCNAGTCGTSCSGGTILCDGSCVDTTSDPSNCGACSHPCPDGPCVMGQCPIDLCGSLTTCTTDAGSYCTNTQTDNANCGSCGNVCVEGEVCSQGTCGCSCASTMIQCGGCTCIDPSADHDHCGATAGCGLDAGSPGIVCGAEQACVGGQCVATCDLDGGIGILCGPEGGAACKDLSSDPDNCGACGNACDDLCPPCPPASACQLGVCQTGAGACMVCCPSDQVECNGDCIDPASSNDYCGASGDCLGASAGHECQPGYVCSNGVCSITCQAGLLLCDGTCVDPATDGVFCGATGNCAGVNQGTTCPSGTSCSGGVCVTPDGG